MSRRKKNRTGIPDETINSLARFLLPAIQKYFESDEGKADFAKWKEEKKARSINGQNDKTKEIL